MWLMHTRYFASAVASDQDPDVLLVRFRHRDHLDLLIADLVALGYPEPKVLAFGYSDYAWRAVVPRDQYKALLCSHVDNLNYTNFKDETTKVSGNALHDAYMGVWTVMHKVQSWSGALRGKAEAIKATPQPKWAVREPLPTTYRTTRWDWGRWDQHASDQRPLFSDNEPDAPTLDSRLVACPGCRNGYEAFFFDPAYGATNCPSCDYVVTDADHPLKPYDDDADPNSPFHVGSGT